jgi:hypothetical protein
MAFMRSLVVLAVLLGSSTAFAQAPGEAPAIPVVDTPTACATQLIPVMADRWSVGLSFGGLGVTPKGATDPTRFGVGELSVRYRLGLHLELAASVMGGGETNADGTPGNLTVGGGVLAARWHFRPEHAWSWYVSAGVGGVSIADKNATQQERDDASRPLGEIGIGVERRWRHLGISAELTAIGLGPTKASSNPTAMPQSASSSSGGSGTMMAPPPSNAIDTADGASGAEFTIGASYYF